MATVIARMHFIVTFHVQCLSCYNLFAWIRTCLEINQTSQQLCRTSHKWKLMYHIPFSDPNISPTLVSLNFVTNSQKLSLFKFISLRCSGIYIVQNTGLGILCFQGTFTCEKYLAFWRRSLLLISNALSQHNCPYLKHYLKVHFIISFSILSVIFIVFYK